MNDKSNSLKNYMQNDDENEIKRITTYLQHFQDLKSIYQLNYLFRI